MSEKLVKKSEVKIPTVAEMVKDIETYKEMDYLNYHLNQEPPKDWVKEHPIIKRELPNGRRVPLRYLPIEKVEYMLRRIFKSYRIEILREGQLFNAVYTTVRVHYLNPVTGEWSYHDGVGAWNMQLNKGATGGELHEIKQSAVVMALPLSKTLAIKDACEMFGTLFGANLNRNDILTASLDGSVKKLELPEGLKNLKHQLDKVKNAEEFDYVENSYYSSLTEPLSDEARELLNEYRRKL